jgi:hypothetical protein
MGAKTLKVAQTAFAEDKHHNAGVFPEDAAAFSIISPPTGDQNGIAFAPPFLKGFMPLLFRSLA